MIHRIVQHIRKSLTAQLCIWVISFVAVLTVASLYIMFHYAREAIYNEAMEKSFQTLRTIELNIDNTLNDVETATRSMRWNVEHHLDHPEMMDSLCHQLVKDNPNILGCAIAFEPGTYPQMGTYFETYAYRNPEDSTQIVVVRNSGKQPYTRENWYAIPLRNEKPVWVDPYHDGDEGATSFMTSYGMALHDSDGQLVGVISTDISMQRFSDMVLNLRPFPHSHIAVIGKDGHMMIHPDSTFVQHEAAFCHAKDSENDEGHFTTLSMLTGQKGHGIQHLDDETCHTFFQPFENTGWSLAIICPESDIFNSYNILRRQTLAICLAGLLLIALFCILISYRQLLPLQQLVHSAKRLSEGHYDDPIDISHRGDEIGYLQNTFRQMKQSLASYINRIHQLTELLRQRNEALEQAYEQVKETERVKDAFIQNMTDQMEHPVKAICATVEGFSLRAAGMTQEDFDQTTELIQTNTATIVELLGMLLDMAEKKEK